MNPWFRFYNEAIDDEKLRLLAYEDRWHFVALLCCKNLGILDENNDLMRRKVAVKLGLTVREAEEVIRRLAEVQLVDQGTWQPLAWEKRQFKSDNATARVKEWRKNKQFPECNNNETLHKRFSNGNVTPPDTDTDTDTDKEEPKTSSASGDAARVFVTKKKRKLKGRQLEMFERFWTVFDHKKDKAQAADAWFDLHVTETLFSAIVLGAEATARERPDAIKAGRTPIYAQGWLSGRRWEDEIGGKKESASSEDYSRYLDAIRAQQ